MRPVKLEQASKTVNRNPKKVIRATDAKEVGVENPSEETFCRPNQKVFARQPDVYKANCQLANYPQTGPLVPEFFPVTRPA